MADQPATIVERHANALVIQVQPETLDEDSTQRIRAEVSAEAAASSSHAVVLDLSRVRFLPSMSLAALIRLLTEFRARRQRLILAGMRPEIRDVFRTARLDRLFELQADVATALNQIRVL